MPVTIRRARPEDAPVVVELNARLAFESEGKTLDLALLTLGVKGALAEPQKAAYYLACDGEQIMGQVMITLEWSDWRNGWFWWIQGVYVRPENRRQGVFRALFQYILQAAKEDPEVIGLRLYVERENAGAQAVYDQLGMKPTGYFVLERYPL